MLAIHYANFNESSFIILIEVALLSNSENIRVAVKKSSTFKVKGSGVKTSNVKWTSSKPSVLSINSKGKATGKKAGTAKITAKCGKFKVTTTVKVKK